MNKHQIDQFWNKGFVVEESVVHKELIEESNRVLRSLIEASRKVKSSDTIYDLSDQHNDQVPSVRRIKHPHLVDPIFDKIMRSKEVLDCVKALLGPNLRMEHSKLLISNKRMEERRLNMLQDWAFYPHSNDDILEVGVLLEDCHEEKWTTANDPRIAQRPR